MDEKKFGQYKSANSDSLFNKWKSTAKRNEDIYWNVFRCTPHDSIKTDKELQQLKKEKADAKEKGEFPVKTEELKKIQGYLVRMPLKFLEKDDLHPRTVNAAPLPVTLFT